MTALYERLNQLKKEIKKLEKDCFNPQARQALAEKRARYDELYKAIKTIEHTEE